MTSYADRTSVVLRGKWILENLLGAPPPPPPPNVPPLKENDAGEQADGAARADGAAPQQPGVRELPRADGSARLRARALRCDRPLARRPMRGAGIDSRSITMHGEPVDEPEGVPRGAARPAATSSCATVSEKLLDLRARPRPRATTMRRRCARWCATLRGNEYRWSSLMLGHRAEHAVPDAACGGQRTATMPRRLQ